MAQGWNFDMMAPRDLQNGVTGLKRQFIIVDKKGLGCIHARDRSLSSIGFKIINLDCVTGRRGIAIQLPSSGLAKLIILKPILIFTV
jgi:hypothetical protein